MLLFALCRLQEFHVGKDRMISLFGAFNQIGRLAIAALHPNIEEKQKAVSYLPGAGREADFAYVDHLDQACRTKAERMGTKETDCPRGH